jgi:fatty-acyl-CoA synthase
MRILINLPPSHVGCVTECFMTCMAVGGTAVMLRIFDPQQSLEAIQAHRVTALGMIPTQYRMLWHRSRLRQVRPGQRAKRRLCRGRR